MDEITKLAASSKPDRYAGGMELAAKKRLRLAVLIYYYGTDEKAAQSNSDSNSCNKKADGNERAKGRRARPRRRRQQKSQPSGVRPQPVFRTVHELPRKNQ